MYSGILKKAVFIFLNILLKFYLHLYEREKNIKIYNKRKEKQLY